MWHLPQTRVPQCQTWHRGAPQAVHSHSGTPSTGHLLECAMHCITNRTGVRQHKQVDLQVLSVLSFCSGGKGGHARSTVACTLPTAKVPAPIVPSMVPATCIVWTLSMSAPTPCLAVAILQLDLARWNKTNLFISYNYLIIKIHTP